MNVECSGEGWEDGETVKEKVVTVEVKVVGVECSDE